MGFHVLLLIGLPFSGSHIDTVANNICDDTLIKVTDTFLLNVINLNLTLHILY